MINQELNKDSIQTFKNKISLYTKCIIFICAIIWIGLLLDRVLLLQKSYEITKFTAKLEFIANFLLIFTSLKIYKKAESNSKNVFLWLILTNVALFLDNLYFYVITYYHNYNFVHISILPQVLDLFPFAIWVISVVVLLIKILKQFALNTKKHLKISLAFATANIIIILIFLTSIHYGSSIFSLPIISQILCFIGQIIILDFVILCLISAETIGFIIFLLGFIWLISGAVLVVYMTISRIYMPTYDELFWFLGILFNLIGVLLIYDMQDFDISKWIRKENRIKSRLVFWCFSIAIISFFIFFIVAYVFSLINKHVLLGFPFFIMLYSVIVIIISMYIGKYFEEPFKQIENNIRGLIFGIHNIDIDEKFSTEEFIFLQNFILEAFKYKDKIEKSEFEKVLAQKELVSLKHQSELEALRSNAEKSKIMQDFGVLAAKVAHDISSPIMVAKLCLKELQNSQNNKEDNIKLIKQSMQDIGNISDNILSTYRQLTGKMAKTKLSKIDDGNIKRYTLVSNLLEKQLEFKKMEWTNSSCNLKLNINANARNLFAIIAPTEFNRNLSNLLNNSFESLDFENNNISINLNIDNNCKSFILKIKDSGCGIPENKLSKVLSGESSKHDGGGMGLSGAKLYFESIEGTLELASKINEGTEVTIIFPIANDPTWLVRRIHYNAHSKFVILDDSSLISMLWQKKLFRLNLECNYFINTDEFIKWYDAQTNKADIILFIDYDLGNEIYTGLDLINKINNQHAFIVTNHAEESWLQNIVNNNNLKLIPKKFIENLVLLKA